MVELILVTSRYYEDKKVFCYICRKITFFTHKDSHNNIGVESHCSECVGIWFEWQNRAVEREMTKWIDYNSGKFALGRVINLEQ
jgi:hypothetical protein